MFSFLKNISIKSFFKKEALTSNKAQDLNIKTQILKEDFFFFLKNVNNITLFKKEWNVLYKNIFFLQDLWFNNTKNSNYFIRMFFYAKNKNLLKKFNLKNKYNNIKKNINYNNVYWGFTSFWKMFKIWIFSFLFAGTFFYVLVLKRTCILPQTLFFWIGVFMLLYWLLSGFVFFVKKYQFSRYTSVIQRFWRRSYILFWLIESGLLLVFFYLVFNSTQESFYMFDQGYFLKSHLFSWKIFIFKCILVVSLITYSYIFLLNLKWNTFNKNIMNLVLITLLLIYFVWMEFYQIYWVSNFYANFFWLYDFEESIWSLEWDARRTRILNHYVMVLFLLKFWHIVFIFGCWIFFLLRSTELENITYPLYSFNFQNFLILFIMMWLFMYPWFKHTFHWFSELPYYWFYVDIHVSFAKIFVNDFFLFYHSLLNVFFEFENFKAFQNTNFINWTFFNSFEDKNVFIKHTIKSVVLNNLI